MPASLRYRTLIFNSRLREANVCGEWESTRTFPFMREAATARMQEHWALRELIGYIRSWSATARYTKQNGVDPAAVLEQGMEHEWGDPTSARKITWPLSLRIGVNPRSWFRSSLQQVILAPMSIEPLARFRGRIECRSDGCGPLGLILSGYTEGRPRELVHLAFAGMAPEDFPQFLESPTVERLDTESYAIASAARRWTVNARAAHL